MYKIFLVEDDGIIARSIRHHLESWEYKVHCVEDFSNVMKEFIAFEPQAGADGYFTAFYNGYLVQRDPQVSKGAGHIYILRSLTI